MHTSTGSAARREQTTCSPLLSQTLERRIDTARTPPVRHGRCTSAHRDSSPVGSAHSAPATSRFPQAERWDNCVVGPSRLIDTRLARCKGALAGKGGLLGGRALHVPAHRSQGGDPIAGRDGGGRGGAQVCDPGWRTEGQSAGRPDEVPVRRRAQLPSSAPLSRAVRLTRRGRPARRAASAAGNS